MLASRLPPSFLDTYSLATSSQVCKALYIVISFLFLWSICLSSSLVHLRKDPEYLTSGPAQVFIPLIRFLLLSFVSMVFHCSPSASKSPEESRTLLSILAYLNIAVDCMVSSSYLPVLSSPYRFFCVYTECTNYNWYHRHFHVPYFLVLLQNLGIYLSSPFSITFTPQVCRTLLSILVGWVLWHINLCRLFNAKSKIISSISNNSV